MQKNREELFVEWLAQEVGTTDETLSKLSGDAGFRRYARMTKSDASFICVDAPPKYSNNKAFVAISSLFNQHDIIAPAVIHYQEQRGFMCLSDFGDEVFSNHLTLETMVESYQLAIDELIKIIHLPKSFADYQLPVYDRNFIETELSIFTQWLLDEHLQLSLPSNELEAMQKVFKHLVSSALEQPQVFMHRDYHSRNIMMLSDGRLGIIDFQDAVCGPITYDIVSLLRDCYIKWPTEKVDTLFDYFIEKLSASALFDYSQDAANGMEEDEKNGVDKAILKKWFDLMGVQRHVKASGIFARLHHRDKKSGYLKDIPLTLSYIVDICSQYEELNPLAVLVEQKVLPACLSHPLHIEHIKILEGSN